MSGFIGKQKVDCIPWKVQRNVKQVIDGPTISLETIEPTPNPMVAMGVNPLTDTTCRKIAWEGCSGSEVHGFEGDTYKFNPASSAYGETQVVTGVSQDKPIPDTAKRFYSCVGGRWLSKSVARDFVDSVTIRFEKSDGGYTWNVSSGNLHYNYCFVEVFSKPNYVTLRSTIISVGPGTSVGTINDTSSASQGATLYCSGQDAMRSITLEY